MSVLQDMQAANAVFVFFFAFGIAALGARLSAWRRGEITQPKIAPQLLRRQTTRGVTGR